MKELGELVSIFFVTLAIATAVNAGLALLPSIAITPHGHWTPVLVRRLKRIWFIAGLPAPFVIALAWMRYPLYDPRGAGQLVAALLPAVAFTVCIHLSWVARRAKWTQAGRCPACGYELHGAGDATTCPECGADVSVEGRSRAIEGHRPPSDLTLESNDRGPPPRGKGR